MRGLVRFLVVIEALVCFGPLLFLLLLGVLLSPIWIISLTLDPEMTGEGGWPSLYSLGMVLLGIVGTIALIFVVLEIISDRQWLNTRVKQSLVALGLLGVMMFNWPWVPTVLDGDMTLEAIWPLLLYLVMPVICSIHLLRLSARMKR
jgi:hypothetical protein